MANKFDHGDKNSTVELFDTHDTVMTLRQVKTIGNIIKLDKSTIDLKSMNSVSKLPC